MEEKGSKKVEIVLMVLDDKQQLPAVVCETLYGDVLVILVQL